MSSEPGIKGNLAHITLEASPLHHRLPPRRLPVKILHLWNGTDHQRPLLVGHQYPDIVRFADIVPPDEVVGDDAIDEEGKLALLIPLTPPLLPILDHALDALRILALIRAVGFGDGGVEKRGGGELLGLVHPTTDLHFDAASGFHGEFFEVGTGHFAKSASLLDVGERKQKGQGQKSNQHDRRDDLALETVSPTPECHGFAPSSMQQPAMRNAYFVKRLERVFRGASRTTGGYFTIRLTPLQQPPGRSRPEQQQRTRDEDR